MPSDKRIYETELNTMWFDDEGILCSVAKRNVQLSVPKLKVVYDMIKKLSNGKKICIVTDMTGVYTSNYEIGRYAKNEMEVFTSAMALIVRSKLSASAGNFFFGFHSYSFPVRMFSKEEEAKEWLRQFFTVETLKD